MKGRYGTNGEEDYGKQKEVAKEFEAEETDSYTITLDGDHIEDNWTSVQYLFSLIGYAIGIGNVWRFCYIVAHDGGSASLFGT